MERVVMDIVDPGKSTGIAKYHVLRETKLGRKIMADLRVRKSFDYEPKDYTFIITVVSEEFPIQATIYELKIIALHEKAMHRILAATMEDMVENPDTYQSGKTEE